MKRFHVHVAVANLAASKRFYSAMFGQTPSVEKEDYAKWMLDDPRLNFAISTRSDEVGVNHLGFQAENEAELESIHLQLQSADATVLEEVGANCCYAKSDKYWVTDPTGIAWESFHTLDAIPTFNAKPVASSVDVSGEETCCIPQSPSTIAIQIPVKAAPTKGACCG
ncbi:glyoxalase [Betaproteobacteria bacterium UKL13-2]|nr:glyoxalase [Betaproteobacteria bacterium UKL13-2]HCG51965.1 glyoxalase/bleomycin resistance/dioxygenase family protein [Betaproteobacteria bacterium]